MGDQRARQCPIDFQEVLEVAVVALIEGLELGETDEEDTQLTESPAAATDVDLPAILVPKLAEL